MDLFISIGLCRYDFKKYAAYLITIQGSVQYILQSGATLVLFFRHVFIQTKLRTNLPAKVACPSA